MVAKALAKATSQARNKIYISAGVKAKAVFSGRSRVIKKLYEDINAENESNFNALIDRIKTLEDDVVEQLETMYLRIDASESLVAAGANQPHVCLTAGMAENAPLFTEKPVGR